MDDLYAVGSVSDDSTGQLKSMIMHYDGTSWKYVIGSDYNLHILTIRKVSGDNIFYLVAYEYTPTGEAVKFFTFNGTDINPIVIGDSTISVFKGITLMGGNLYFTNEYEIYKLEAGRIKHLLSMTQFSKANKSRIWGRNEKDFFMKSSDGIGHYNGKDLQTVYTINGDFVITAGLILSDDVYFIYYYLDTFSFRLVHGKRTSN